MLLPIMQGNCTICEAVVQLQNAKLLQDLAFIVDVAEHLNNLNKMLQGLNKVRQ